MKAKDIRVGMRYRVIEQMHAVDSRVKDVELLFSGKTLLPRGVIIELEDGSTIQWMDPDAEVPEVS